MTNATSNRTPKTFNGRMAAIARKLGVERVGVTGTDDGDHPLPWTIFDPCTDDILGAGHTIEAAAADAYATVSAW